MIRKEETFIFQKQKYRGSNKILREIYSRTVKKTKTLPPQGTEEIYLKTHKHIVGVWLSQYTHEYGTVAYLPSLSSIYQVV